MKADFHKTLEVLRTETDDYYEFVKENIRRFDTSYNKMGNTIGIHLSERLLEKTKDEFPNDITISFYGRGTEA